MDPSGCRLIAFIIPQSLVFVLLAGGLALVLFAIVSSGRRREKERAPQVDALNSPDEEENSRMRKQLLSGLPLRERLAACDVQDDWDRALAARDRPAMILTLRRTLLSEHDSARTADAVLNDPGKYGF